MTVKRWVKFAVALVGWLTANEGRGGILVQFANVPEHAKTLQLLGYLGAFRRTRAVPSAFVQSQTLDLSP